MSYQKIKPISKARVWAFSFLDGAFVCLFVGLIGLLIAFPFLNDNNRAILDFIQKKHEQASQKWHSALSQNPFSPLYRLNLALNYQIGEQIEKALQEYTVLQNLLHSKNKKPVLFKKEDQTPLNALKNLLFYNFFNSAVAESQRGHILKALDFYQQALEFHPDSLTVKTNIEILTQTQKNKKNGSDSKNQNQDQSQSKKPENNKQDQNEDQTQTEKPDKEQNQGEKPEDNKQNQKEDQNKEQGQDEALENNKQDQNEDPNQGEKPEGYEANNDTNKDRKLNPSQIEAILKSISEQEKNLKNRRQKARKKPSHIEKDW